MSLKLKKLLLFLFMLLPWGPVFPQSVRVIPLPVLENPCNLVLDGPRIFVVDGVRVFVFSSQDFKLITQFGKAGEGPGEFRSFAKLFVDPKELVVNSRGKVSIFSKEGALKSEKRVVQVYSGCYCKIGNKFVAVDSPEENDVTVHTINLYNEDLVKERELFRQSSDVQIDKKINSISFGVPVNFTIFHEKIIVEKGKNSIEIIDLKGNRLTSIIPPIARVKINSNHKKKYRDYFKKNKHTKGFYRKNKHRFYFPDYFPRICTSLVADGKIYILTFRMNDSMSEFYVYRTSGAFEGIVKLRLPVRFLMTPYPFDIQDGKIYKLVENMEKEEWELHVLPIKIS